MNTRTSTVVYHGSGRRAKEVAIAMRWSRSLAFAAICAVALLWTAASAPSSEMGPLVGESVEAPTAAADRILRNTSVGFRLTVPKGWIVTRQLVATQFAVGAACQSVRIVDFQPAPDSGPGAKVLHSFVQLCWRRVRGDSLTAFIETTYGERAASLFEKTELGGVPAYRTKKNGLDATVFLQTDAYRIQVVTALVADAAKRNARRVQLQGILASFSVNP